MRLIISAVTWDEFLRSGMCQLELVPLAEKYGCAGIEFRPYWRSPVAELPEIKDFLAEYGLVCTYACHETLLAESPAAVRRTLAAMADNLAVAELLGAGLLRIKVATDQFDRSLLAAAWWQQAVNELLDLAAAKGITLALENAPDATRGDPRLIRDILTMFSSPWLKATFDTGNWLPAGWDPGQALAMLSQQVGYVHLKDMIPRPEGFVPTYPGGGSIDLLGLIAKLEQSGYQGLFALEFPGGQSPAAGVKASLRYLRQE
jgi:sugar phosphate isomerase/epimerase